MGDRKTVIEDFHIDQGVMAATSHHDSIFGSSYHNSTARHAVYRHATMAIQVDARTHASGGRILPLPAIRQRGIASSVDHHGSVMPGSARSLDSDVVLPDGEGTVPLSASNPGIRFRGRKVIRRSTTRRSAAIKNDSRPRSYYRPVDRRCIAPSSRPAKPVLSAARRRNI